MSDKKLIRNSTAEFLMFTAQDGKNSIETRYKNETIWLTQKLIAELFEVDISTVNEHLKNIYKNSELDKSSTIGKFPMVQKEGNRAESGFEQYYITQDRLFQSDFDKLIIKQLEGGGGDE
jgi:hypothetical protein